MKNEDKIICRCEEVTEKEIREAIKEGYTSLKDIKRITRAGMGLCQGRTCSTLISQIIAEMTGKKYDDIVPDTARFPFYPVEIEKLAESRKKK
jgi:NAD(P)H-nitrite reductase large subunit